MSTKAKTRCMVAFLALAIASLLVVGAANAQTPPGPDPANCTSNSIGVNAITVLPAGPKLPGQTVEVTIEFENTGGTPCFVIDFSSDLHMPDTSTISLLSGATIAPGETFTCPGDGRCVTAGPYEYTVSTDDAVGSCSGCPPTCDEGDFNLSFYVSGQGDNLSGVGSTTDANACLGITQQLLSCEVLVDKQVSCDGGTTWADAGLVASNEDGTNGCTAADGATIMVRYQAENIGTADVVDCVIEETNTAFGPGPLVGPILSGVTTEFIPAFTDPLCSDSLEANEPDTATLTCECVNDTTEIFATAEDTATLECVSTELDTNSGPDANDGNTSPGIDRNDTATLTGDAECQGGDVQFFLCDPSEVTGAGCPEGSGDAVGSPVSIATGTAMSDTVNPTLVGHYCWGAAWSGFGVCPAQYFTNNTDECFDIACPPISTLLSKTANPTTGTPPFDVTYTYRETNTGEGDIVNVNVSDPDCTPLVRGTDDPGNNDDVLNAGETWVFTCTKTIDQECVDGQQITNTATATGTNAIEGCPAHDDEMDTATVTLTCPGACRMTGGHVNMAGSVDAGFADDSGTKYTTGGQIGAPNESGCADSPWKGVCDDGTCFGGLANGEPCETNTDCPNDSGHNSTRPWGDWEHNHHSGPDDGFISGGSFSFHSGTAAAPDEAFISNIICQDPGWCVQARPAPNKQIFWEGTGVFHNLKGAKGTELPLPDFGECPVQVWDKKTGGSLHYYRAHVVDSGEPAGQRQKPVTEDCLTEEACLGDWAIAGCNAVEGGCDIPAVDNVDKTALHPLCLAQDCTDCPDWYDIEIHCTDDPASPVIYKVGHFILEGNFQLHPPVGDSCNFSCDGVCETGALDFIEACDPNCDLGDCCD